MSDFSSNTMGGTGMTGGGTTGSQPAGEKKDWLDKGIEAAGKKLGFNVVSSLEAILVFVGSG